ncbi:MAG: trypsin-like peptidase domain-containing protein [Candidatus Bathyarchaeota archaeon]|nr:trypsin-like peptidase domain-containing protein [Candidatus Bathyarchaeota archaeon]
MGGLGSYFVNTRQVNNLANQVDTLQHQVSTFSLHQNQTVNNQTITLYQNSTSIVEIYEKASPSVVLIRGTTEEGDVQGSGFVYNYTGRMVVLTNFHVVQDTTSVSVTFSNGNGYAAEVLGTDPYADLAVLSVAAPSEELKPLPIVSSSSLRVGEQVIAIGNPYGLVGSLSSGLISALGRSEQMDFTSSFSMANMIQTSTPINPGNSGGPLLNMLGEVVGITNSGVFNSQSLVFAVPSNTVLRELPSLIEIGTYGGHSYLGIHVVDMSYELAQELGLNVTYGVWIPSETGQTIIVPSGPSDGKIQEGDVVIAMNGTRIKSNDDMASYLEENTLPDDVLVITVLRDNSTVDVNVTLGTRPPPSL